MPALTSPSPKSASTFARSRFAGAPKSPPPASRMVKRCPGAKVWAPFGCAARLSSRMARQLPSPPNRPRAGVGLDLAGDRVGEGTEHERDHHVPGHVACAGGTGGLRVQDAVLRRADPDGRHRPFVVGHARHGEALHGIAGHGAGSARRAVPRARACRWGGAVPRFPVPSSMADSTDRVGFSAAQPARRRPPRVPAPPALPTYGESPMVPNRQ